MKGGYCGKLIEVDLTSRTIDVVPLPPENVLNRYVGGAALGLYMLHEEIFRGRLSPNATILDPESPIFLLTGPLTGTNAPSASDWTIVNLHGVVPYAPCVSHAHGHFGARLKHAGYDGIIVRGASDKPVYLWIDDDTIELRDADHLWGKDTFETPDAIRTGQPGGDQISVACIGPAGEEILRGASVRSEGAYGANKGGAGMAWGSKKLKAIAVRGTGSVPIANKDRFLDSCAKWRRAAPGPGRFQEADGVRMMGVLSQIGMVPGKNFTDPEFQRDWGRKYEADMKQWKITPVGSWECEYKCHSDTLITTGPFAGTRVVGYVAEVIEDSATILGIEDPGTGLVMANFYDAMGCDPAEAGRLIAMAFEMYNKGLLTKAETGGLELDWGNDEAARELFTQILYRQEPLGSILAEGHKRAVATLGKGHEDMFVHIKGAGFNSHDLRGTGIGMVFGIMMSGAGPTWQGIGAEGWVEPDLGYRAQLDPASPVGKAEACFKTAVKKLWEDSIGVCWFACLGVENITKMVPEALSLALGREISWPEAFAVGTRALQLQRLIAVRRGFEKKNDLEASERILADAGIGPAKGRTLKPHLNQMVDEYYEIAGWDMQTGVPKQETLEALGMGEYAVGLS